jgi:hypothetical protein
MQESLTPSFSKELNPLEEQAACLNHTSRKVGFVKE